MSKRNRVTEEMLDRVKGLSAVEAGKVLGVPKSTVHDARTKFRRRADRAPERERLLEPKSASKKNARNSSIESKRDGSLIVSTTDTVPQTREHIEERMRSRGFDPADYSLTYGFSEWEAQTPDGIQTLYSARASATERKRGPENEPLDMEALEALVADYVPVRGEASGGADEGDPFVFCFADPQAGKVDINGGTDEMVARFLASLDRACAILDEAPTSQIIWADLGDGIENFCNTSSQRQTNDLNLVEQVRLLRRMQVEGLLRLSEYAPIVHVSVPSNHSQNRVGFQQPASTAHDDWGIEVQEQLRELFAIHETAHPITFVKPDEHLESVSIETEGGTVLGFVHGHRSSSQNGLEAWWAGQSLGMQPTAQAHILLVGHFHNFSVKSVGSQRYLITTPSLDNGSSWFTVSRGNVATAGVLTLRIRKGVPTDMRIV